MLLIDHDVLRESRRRTSHDDAGHAGCPPLTLDLTGWSQESGGAVNPGGRRGPPVALPGYGRPRGLARS
jgi:hypothetical protein